MKYIAVSMLFFLDMCVEKHTHTHTHTHTHENVSQMCQLDRYTHDLEQTISNLDRSIRNLDRAIRNLDRSNTYQGLLKYTLITRPKPDS